MNTIAAIATAPGTGGIGIVRMSGPECYAILDNIFLPKNKEKTNKKEGYTIHYGHIINTKTKEKIDEVLVSYFKAPYSYTTEDMCEINCHGGMVILQEILENCLRNGAKIAEPGEFTKRAFLNGRIDLSQAESVIDLINAKSKKEAQTSLKQLEGNLSSQIQKIRQEVLDIMVQIEASIDYPEYDVEEVTNDKAQEELLQIKEELIELEKSFENGKIIKEGIKTAIIGRPNSGKSSLLNAMLKEERAIVTDIEGTTRDTIEEFICVQGIPLHLIDTAGIRQARDEVEKIGIEKTRKVAQEADFIIAILDSTKSFSKEDEEILHLTQTKPSLVLWNKIDLTKDTEKQKEIEKDYSLKTIPVSIKQGQGLEKVYEEISSLFHLGEITNSGETMITNIRHKNLISESLKNLEEGLRAIENNLPIDLISIHIKNMLENLGEIIGENVSENIIKEIFARFCLGK